MKFTDPLDRYLWWNHPANCGVDPTVAPFPMVKLVAWPKIKEERAAGLTAIREVVVREPR
jgi:hypothetical protein